MQLRSAVVSVSTSVRWLAKSGSSCTMPSSAASSCASAATALVSATAHASTVATVAVSSGGVASGVFAEADVAITAGAFATLRASGSVEGTADGAGSRVENAGPGACQVAATNLAVVSCAAPP